MRVVLFIIVAIYAWSLSKPLTTIVEFTINQEQIAKEFCENKDKPVLACNGKCYLMKQLAKEVDADTPQNDNKKEKKDNLKSHKKYERINDRIRIEKVFLVKTEKIVKPYLRAGSEVYFETIIPPPQFV